MLPVIATLLERLTAAYRRGERLVLVFDYDGTLTQDSGLRPHLRRRNRAVQIVLCVANLSRSA